MSIQRLGHRYIDVETQKTVDTWYPTANARINRSCLAEKHGLVKGEFTELTIDSLDVPPLSTEDAYLRLHLLSERAVAPNCVNLDGIFALLPIVAWTSAGPVFPQHVESLRNLVAADYHHLTVPSIDRFPRMSDYVIPSGVRIADASRVRLGAHRWRTKSFGRQCRYWHLPGRRMHCRSGLVCHCRHQSQTTRRHGGNGSNAVW